jgi:hypothetical protein
MNRIQQGNTARRIQSFDTKNAPPRYGERERVCWFKGAPTSQPGHSERDERQICLLAKCPHCYGLALQARHCKHYRKQKLFTIQQVAFHPPFEPK